jgi:predicted TIM-barrel fold metal-dependent hydrolase
MIVDTHVHVVTGDRMAYPQRPDAPEWPLTTIETLSTLMDGAGVNRALLVQTYFTYGYDNSYMTACAASNPHRFLAVCVLDPLSPGAPDQLSALVELHRVRGIRLMNDRQKNVVSIDNPETFALWERIAELGVPVCIAALVEEVPRVRTVAERFPRVPIALDHIWGLDVGTGPAFTTIDPVLDLASLPNILLKIAPNNSHAVSKTGSKPEDFYRRVIGAFGLTRVMWGSNYPAHAHAYGSLRDRVALAHEDLAFLSNAERAAIMGGNALRLWPELRS